MRYCKKCVQPDTRPGLKFDKDGVCYACRFQERIDKVNWVKREEQLRKIVKWAKNRSSTYDCVIGVSGGKDSLYQSLYAKEKLGLNCLLVNLAPDPITEWGKHNIENLIQLGFDTLKFRPNPKIWKKLIKYSFYKYGNPVKPAEYPLWAVSYITALKFEIPLIIQGENAGITLGVTKGLGRDGNALNVNLGNTLSGGNASDWTIENIELDKLIWYQFPDKKELIDSGIRAIYLNYYDKNWSYSRNIEFAKKHGLIGRKDHNPRLTGRISPYCSIDSDMQIVN
ncbi:MAG: N-acetyl sugar amidotransferase [Atribacterota bacterium]